MEKKDSTRNNDSKAIAQLDRAVVAELPNGCTVLSVTPSGKSAWVGTVKIRVRLANGDVAEYFKKGASGHIGVSMMQGAFEAERALYAVLPSSVPRPRAWGTYEDDPDMHFYMCNFVEMLDHVPSARDGASTVSSLHLNSIGKSSTGMFGFHVDTHLASIRVNNAWSPSWELFWKQQMKSLFDHEERVRGFDAALSRLKTAYLDKVIPRYLGPLESGGRSIKPCLIHSDLWPGNIKPMASKTELCMFDTCAYWGHNEADLGICRNPRYKLGPPCVREYLKHIPASEPIEDFEGRNAVYAMKYHALLSIMYFTYEKFRNVFMDELQVLVDKVTSEDQTKEVRL